MKRTRFTDEQIVGILKEHEAGTPVSELCRKHGVSNPRPKELRDVVLIQSCY